MDIYQVSRLFGVPEKCVSKSHVASEHHKRLVILGEDFEIFKIELDYDDGDTSKKTIDYAFLIMEPGDLIREIILVELKGCDISHGFKQMESSLNKYCQKGQYGRARHDSYKSIRGIHDTRAFIIAQKNRLNQNQNISYQIIKKYGVHVVVKTGEYRHRIS